MAERKFEDEYEQGTQLGKGSFSTVFSCTNKKTKKNFAVKIIDKKQVGLDSKSQKRLETEVEILKKVSHPNIVALHDVFENKDKLYLVMDLVEGGQLFDKILQRGYYSEKDAVGVIQKLFAAIDYLHQHNIIHRDLKPENLLLHKGDDTEIMLSDFGLSRILGDESMASTACGTPYYVAPEILGGHGYSKEVDLWSLGVITYFLLAGFPPFMGESLQEIADLIMRADFEFSSPYFDDVSKEAKDFVKRLLVADPADRMSTQEALNHPWLKKGHDGKPVSLKNGLNKFLKLVKK